MVTRPTEIRYWVGVDFGQAADYTAISVIERVEGEAGEDLHVRALERPPLRTSYEKIAKGVVRRLVELEPGDIFGQRFPIGLCVDATGVGRGVVDMLHREIRALGGSGPRIRLWPVIVTGGTHPTLDQHGGFLRVPKRDLITSALVALQNNTLKIAESIPEKEVLVEELLSYRVKVTLAGHDSYEPWREGQHDDLLFATALSCWAWQQTSKPRRPGRNWGGGRKRGKPVRGSMRDGFFR